MKWNKLFGFLIFAVSLEILCSLSPDKNEIQHIFGYLTTHPQSESNYAERLKYLKKIDDMSRSCSDTLFRDYMKGLPVDCSMKGGKILCYLDTAINHVISGLNRKNDINDNDVYLWHIYNMGYVVLYKNEFLGVDIMCKNADRFAPCLEVLLNTHPHADHYSNALISAMEKLKKPFISNWYNNKYKTNTDTTFRIGSFVIKTSIGDHHYWSGDRNDMLMFLIEVNGVRIFHGGDNSNIGRLKDLKNLDCFITHHEVGMSYNDAVALLEPKVDVISHIMELGHAVHKWRWTYAHADSLNMRRGNYNKGLLLSWGERIKLN